MSRETDSSSPHPRGWGEPERGEGEGGARNRGPQPDERTESTVETTVTRARISIPGSRPIPPIVVRQPVEETAARGIPSVPQPAAQAQEAEGQDEQAAEAGADGGKTSSWFEPRKSPRGTTPPGGTPTGNASPAAPPAAGAGAAAGFPAAGAPSQSPGPGAAPPGTQPAGGFPPGDPAAGSAPGFAFPSAAEHGPAVAGTPAPGETGYGYPGHGYPGPQSPGSGFPGAEYSGAGHAGSGFAGGQHPGGFAGGHVSGAGHAGPGFPGAEPFGSAPAEPGYPGSESAAAGFAGSGFPGAAPSGSGYPGPAAAAPGTPADGTQFPGFPGHGTPPAGTSAPGGAFAGHAHYGAEPSGPATPEGEAFAGGAGAAHPPVETPAGGIPGLGRAAPAWFPATDDPPEGTAAYPSTPAGGVPPAGPVAMPSGPTSGPATGDMPLRPPGEELAATTMDLGGPFPPAPPPGHRQQAAAADLDATGALPRVDPDPAVSEPDGVPPTAEKEPGPEAQPRPAAGGGRKASRGLKLLLAGVAGIGVVAYGAGLLFSSDDVPEGTTVLGVDLGGTTSQEAANRLDAALERSNTEPLTLRIDGEEHELRPSVAGLVVDTEESVRAAASRDYSPVSVIGSLFGAERTQDAVFAIDREKLTAALEDLAADMDTDAPVNGTVTFENGQAIGDPGQPGETIDVRQSANTVVAAFRDRAATGRNPAVELPLVTQDPLVGEAEVERALEEFGEPAMSGWVWLVAADREIPFSPETLSGLMTMEPSESGSLQPVLDTEALAYTYGSTFDGVMIDGGSGLVPMTPEHAAAAMIPALRETAVTDTGEGRREGVVASAVVP